MSWTLRAVYYIDTIVDELPSDLEGYLLEAIEDGTADIALCGDVTAVCNLCDLPSSVCQCVPDDVDAWDLDSRERAA